eukprot:jgi/Mesvir1/7113/Mv09217-RA.1
MSFVPSFLAKEPFPKEEVIDAALAKERIRHLQALEDALRQLILDDRSNYSEARTFFLEKVSKCAVSQQQHLRRFLDLLPSATSKPHHLERRQPAVRKLLQLLCEARPAAVSKVISECPPLLQSFFQGDPGRSDKDSPLPELLLTSSRAQRFFSHAGGGGYNTPNRLGNPPASSARSNVNSSSGVIVPGAQQGQGSRALAHFAFAHRDVVWQHLVWRGAHPRSPIMLASNPELFSELDAVASLRQVSRAMPSFWSSPELRAAVVGGPAVPASTSSVNDGAPAGGDGGGSPGGSPLVLMDIPFFVDALYGWLVGVVRSSEGAPALSLSSLGPPPGRGATHAHDGCFSEGGDDPVMAVRQSEGNNVASDRDGVSARTGDWGDWMVGGRAGDLAASVRRLLKEFIAETLFGELAPKVLHLLPSRELLRFVTSLVDPPPWSTLGAREGRGGGDASGVVGDGDSARGVRGDEETPSSRDGMPGDRDPQGGAWGACLDQLPLCAGVVWDRLEDAVLVSLLAHAGGRVVRMVLTDGGQVAVGCERVMAAVAQLVVGSGGGEAWVGMGSEVGSLQGGGVRGLREGTRAVLSTVDAGSGGHLGYVDGNPQKVVPASTEEVLAPAACTGQQGGGQGGGGVCHVEASRRALFLYLADQVRRKGFTASTVRWLALESCVLRLCLHRMLRGGAGELVSGCTRAGMLASLLDREGIRYRVEGVPEDPTRGGGRGGVRAGMNF